MFRAQKYSIKGRALRNWCTKVVRQNRCDLNCFNQHAKHSLSLHFNFRIITLHINIVSDVQMLFFGSNHSRLEEGTWRRSLTYNHGFFKISGNKDRSLTNLATIGRFGRYSTDGFFLRNRWVSVTLSIQKKSAVKSSGWKPLGWHSIESSVKILTSLAFIWK